MTDRLHFIENDLIIYFPQNGNEGREIPKYGVAYFDRKNVCPAHSGRIYLEDLLEKCPNIKNEYPHIIGYFNAERQKYPPNTYKQKKKITNASELYQWIKELGI